MRGQTAFRNIEIEKRDQPLRDRKRRQTTALRDANAHAVDAERMAVIATLSAGLGHDMANLLVPVHIRLEALARMDLPGDAHEHLAAIKASAEFLQKLSSGLRMLAAEPARAAHGEATNLTAWWEEASSILRAVLPGSVSLETELPAAPVWVHMTQAALMQAVFNLVQNAGDVLRGRTDGRVVIKAWPDRGHVRITVSDNGAGMADDVRRRCFEPFFTTRHRSISTGLGLSIVYGLVKEAGGEIDVHSEPGRGTTCTLRLERAEDPDQARATRRTAVVEVDDLRLRALVAMELRALAYDVTYDTHPDSPPDLVVSDRLPRETAPGTRLILFTDAPDTPASAIALGSKPAVQAIRAALRDATASSTKEGTP